MSWMGNVLGEGAADLSFSCSFAFAALTSSLGGEGLGRVRSGSCASAALLYLRTGALLRTSRVVDEDVDEAGMYGRCASAALLCLRAGAIP